MITRNRNIFFIVIVGFLVISIILIIFAFIFKKPDSISYEDTGGSGTSTNGSLFIKNINEPLDQYLTLGEAMPLDLQEMINSVMREYLVRKNRLPQYDGYVVKDSASLDESSGDVNFEVKVDKPKTLFRVKFNTNHPTYIYSVEVDGFGLLDQPG